MGVDGSDGSFGSFGSYGRDIERWDVFLGLGRHSFDDFETKAGVVIWAFPETGLVVGEVERAVGTNAPVPFSIFMVDDVVVDIFPAALCDI